MQKGPAILLVLLSFTGTHLAYVRISSCHTDVLKCVTTEGY